MKEIWGNQMAQTKYCTECGEPNPHAALRCSKCGTSFDVIEMLAASKQETVEKPKGVIISGVQIPFVDLVALLVKTALAAIPALIILVFIGFVGMLILGAMGILAV